MDKYKIFLLLILSAVFGFSFGKWQHNWGAGLFMGTLSFVLLTRYGNWD